jgi:hypothetical protein
VKTKPVFLKPLVALHLPFWQDCSKNVAIPMQLTLFLTVLRNFDTNILQRLDQLVDGNNPAQNKPREIAAQLNSTIFGAKIPAITNAVAAFSGVKPSTATALLGFTSPMVMALLSQKINAEGLRSSALVRYLLGERSRIVSLLPAGGWFLVGYGKH